MLFYLFEFLEKNFDFPGQHLYRFISFRAALAVILSLIITIIFGKKMINYIRNKQIGETIRDLGLEGQVQKQGTPTMGGLIILLSILVPVLLLNDLSNIYIQLILLTTVWLGMFGFIDDYIKVFKKNKKGLKGKYKVLGQIIIGCVLGFVMLKSNQISVRVLTKDAKAFGYEILKSYKVVNEKNPNEVIEYSQVKSTMTNVPFFKGNQWDYTRLLWFLGPENSRKYVWIVFIPLIFFIVTAVSNGANLTDGLDGLATGVSAIIAFVLIVFAYVSSNTFSAEYLNILYIPNSAELVIFSAAFLGACFGFLWYNAYPAQIFMGDTGSLMIGGVIATLAIFLRKELLIPILCGIFMIESLSVLMQVGYFKYTKKKYGEGRRIFKMSPIHHHYQKVGIHESKIVSRFWIIGILLAVLTIITLKIR